MWNVEREIPWGAGKKREQQPSRNDIRAVRETRQSTIQRWKFTLDTFSLSLSISLSFSLDIVIPQKFWLQSFFNVQPVIVIVSMCFFSVVVWVLESSWSIYILFGVLIFIRGTCFAVSYLVYISPLFFFFIFCLCWFFCMHHTLTIEIAKKIWVSVVKCIMHGRNLASTFELVLFFFSLILMLTFSLHWWISDIKQWRMKTEKQHLPTIKKREKKRPRHQKTRFSSHVEYRNSNFWINVGCHSKL